MGVMVQDGRQKEIVLDLSIVIVHYNTSSDLLRCLESIFAHRPSCSLWVTVVDNASTEAGLDSVRERFTGVDWILNSQNVGYAKGCNQGMAAHQANQYLILNPDIVVQPGALDNLMTFAAAHPRAGIIGPQLLNEDGTIQDSCRRFYTLGTLLLRRTFLGKLFPESQIVRRHLMGDFDHMSSRPVDWVLGGCMLVSHSALERTGPMDERFFLYFEDVDWCYRMWQAGCEVLYSPDARFHHRHRRSSAGGTLNRSFWLHLGSLISFYEKWGLLVWLVKRWRDPLLMFLFWLTDMAAVGVGFVGAYGARKLAGFIFPQELFPFGEYQPLLVYTLLLSTVVFLGSGRYAPGSLRGAQKRMQDMQRVGIIFMLLLASTYLGHMEVISRAVLLIYLPVLMLAITTSRGLWRQLLLRLERGHLALERTLLSGPFDQVSAWLEGLGQRQPDGVDLVGYVCPLEGDGVLPPLASGTIPWLGRPADLVGVARRYRVSQVVIWTSLDPESETLRRWGALRRLGLRLRWQTPEAWLLATGARVEMFGGRLGGVRGVHQTGLLSILGRRALSLVSGLVLAVISAPVRLWDRLSGRLGKGVECRTVCLHDAWGFDPELEILTTDAGVVLPLHRQWGLARALLRGKITLLGPWSLADGVNWREPDPEGMLVFWGSEPVPCSLAATNGDKKVQESFVTLLRRFWLHPGGLLTLASQGVEGRTLTDPSRSCNEVE